MRKYVSIILVLIFNILCGGVDVYISAIKLLINEGIYDQANDKYLLAITEYDASAELFFIGGQTAINLDNLDEANKRIIQAIELDNNNEEYRTAQINLEKLKIENNI